ncbi:TPA: ABC-three component system middle component 1 [Bacillus anthracis]|uniref:Uncharacterized protein n=1 Tax=Bacillus paranthracis TaxID=2026186 RepID=A0A5M9GZ11_9BACI|nr:MULTISPECIES: ABC-three component system middle component 1 [Bacillus cereus group]HDR4495704.1 hypothetical protein [Bacillus cereus biovar anthracis]KAA8479005.1 hypothetical protein FYW06_08995 [Bacillus paranthracis]MCU5253996.1 hypothetical protein [Bacillus cereus]MDZ4466015.1 hypothetical protein [Bacillus cereus]MDZ4550605.1 hypothetical protein [Bacillus cereus]
MSLHYVVGELTKKHEYNNIFFSHEELNQRLRDRNLEVWQKGNRYIVTKSYTSIAQLSDWLYDQIAISFIYDAIPAHSRNNLYFLLVVDFKSERNKEMVWKITEIEKNDRVCRKYVVETKKDLKRVPALNNNFMESDVESIDFERFFKRRLFNNKVITAQYGEMNQSIKELVNIYFEIYDEQDNKEAEEKALVEDVLHVRSELD